MAEEALRRWLDLCDLAQGIRRKGLTTLEGVVLAEEFARVKAPMRADFFGDTLVGPTLLQWGTEEQKKEFLPRILNGSIRWCQGFSEPNSGSDLASLMTSAVLDGDEWIINGQKVWTTGGHHADYCFLLTRTDPDAPKHKGISYLLVPMRQPGVEVRGITNPTARPSSAKCSSPTPDARRTTSSAGQQRLEGGQLDARVRAWPIGDHRLQAVRRRIQDARRAGGCQRPPADPVIRQRLTRYYTKIRCCGSTACARCRGPCRASRIRRRRTGRNQQDVLERNAQGGHGARPRHLRLGVDARRHRARRRFVARQFANGAPAISSAR